MIVVSGASRGIGRALADRLTSHGYEVVGVARTPTTAEFEVIRTDVSSESDVKNLARYVRGRTSNLVALINAAGIANMNLALMAPPKTVRATVDTNLLGTIFMCQSLAPLMIRNGSGSIINFSTIAVPLALEGESAYVASKAGVEAFSRTLARELGGHNVRVNCVAPGPIKTSLIKGVPREQIDRIISRQILRRMFTVEDVCNVVELLLDSRSESLTGQTFHVGGV